MSMVMEEKSNWTAKRKSALVIEILQGKTTVSEASRAADLPRQRLKPGSMKRSVKHECAACQSAGYP